ncbi:hypothetical protein SODALDRAFT_329779, partial [Sodiomyces alkalinus F11]
MEITTFSASSTAAGRSPLGYGGSAPAFMGLMDSSGVVAMAATAAAVKDATTAAVGLSSSRTGRRRKRGAVIAPVSTATWFEGAGLAKEEDELRKRPQHPPRLVVGSRGPGFAVASVEEDPGPHISTGELGGCSGGGVVGGVAELCPRQGWSRWSTTARTDGRARARQPTQIGQTASMYGQRQKQMQESSTDDKATQLPGTSNVDGSTETAQWERRDSISSRLVSMQETDDAKGKATGGKRRRTSKNGPPHESIRRRYSLVDGSRPFHRLKTGPETLAIVERRFSSTASTALGSARPGDEPTPDSPRHSPSGTTWTLGNASYHQGAPKADYHQDDGRGKPDNELRSSWHGHEPHDWTAASTLTRTRTETVPLLSQTSQAETVNFGESEVALSPSAPIAAPPTSNRQCQSGRARIGQVLPPTSMAVGMEWQLQSAWHLYSHSNSGSQLQPQSPSQTQSQLEQRGVFPAHRSPVLWDNNHCPLSTNIPGSVLGIHTETIQSPDLVIPSRTNVSGFPSQSCLHNSGEEEAGNTATGSTNRTHGSTGRGQVGQPSTTAAAAITTDERAGTTVTTKGTEQSEPQAQQWKGSPTVMAAAISGGQGKRSEVGEGAGHTTVTTTTCPSISPIVPDANTQHAQQTANHSQQSQSQHAQYTSPRHLPGAQYHSEHHPQHYPEHQHHPEYHPGYQYHHSGYHEYETQPHALLPVPLQYPAPMLHRLGTGTTSSSGSPGEISVTRPNPPVSLVGGGSNHPSYQSSHHHSSHHSSHYSSHHPSHQSSYHSHPTAPVLPGQWPIHVSGSMPIPVSVTPPDHSAPPLNRLSSTQTPVSPAVALHAPPRPSSSDATDSCYPYPAAATAAAAAAASLNPSHHDHNSETPVWASTTPLSGPTLAVSEPYFPQSLQLWPHEEQGPPSSYHHPPSPSVYPPHSSYLFSPLPTFSSQDGCTPRLQYVGSYTDLENMTLRRQQDSADDIGSGPPVVGTQAELFSHHASPRTGSQRTLDAPSIQPETTQTQVTHKPRLNNTPTATATATVPMPPGPHDSQKLAGTSVALAPQLSADITRTTAPNLPEHESWVDLDSIHLRLTLDPQPAPTETTPSGLPTSEPADAYRQRITRGCFSDKERQETAETRRMKACMRCRIQRVRCVANPENPRGDCLTCTRVDRASRKTIRPIFCMRYKVTDVILHRPAGSLGLTRRWQNGRITDLGDWDAPTVRTIQIMQPMCPEPFKLEVRKFVPRQGDRLDREWLDGSLKKVKPVAPYALADIRRTVRYFRTYVTRCARDAFQKYCTGSNDNLDPLIAKNYQAAVLHHQSPDLPADQRQLLDTVFRLWFATQLTLGSSWLHGPETLDMEPETDLSYPRPNTVPTPRMVVAQFDFLYPLEILKPLRAAVLKDLEKLVHSANRTCFFTVYISIFILLNLVSQMCQDDRRRQANLYAQSTSSPQKISMRYHLVQFVEEVQRSALVMLCHWHYYKGQDEVLGAHTVRNLPLTPEQTALYTETSSFMTNLRENGLLALDDYENPSFWTAQMFPTRWTPGSTYTAPYYDNLQA